MIYRPKITNFLKYHKSSLIIVWGFFGGLFTYVFSKLIVIKPDGMYIGQPNAWSDWVVHISITNVFANKPIAEWFLYHPFFAYGKLTYGFLVHLLTALIMRLGFRIDTAFFIISVLLLFTFLTGLYFLYYQVSNSRKSAVLGIFIFFTSSGMGIFRYLGNLKLNSFKLNNLLHLTQDFTKFTQYEWLAGNIPVAMIIPQRAFFIGVTIGVWVINLLLWGLDKHPHKIGKKTLNLSQKKNSKFDTHIKSFILNQHSPLIKKFKNISHNWSWKLKLNKQQKLFLTAGILAGILPIAHMHSFIAIVIVTGTICFFYIFNKHDTPLVLNKHSPVVRGLKYIPKFYIAFWFKKLGPLSKFVSKINIPQPYGQSFQKYKKKSIQKLKQLLFFIVPAGIISTFLYFKFIHGGIEIDNFMTISLGWTVTKTLPKIGIGTNIIATLLTPIFAWIKMWLQLWGTFIPLVIFALFYLQILPKLKFNYKTRLLSKLQNSSSKKTQIQKHLSLFLGFILIFILANIVVFQPTAWDNTKLFAWVYLGLSILVSQLLFKFWNKPTCVYTSNFFRYMNIFSRLGILSNLNMHFKLPTRGESLLKTRGAKCIPKLSKYQGKLKQLKFKVLTVILIITLSFSGFIELVRLFNFQQNTHRLSSTQEITLAKKIANNTQTDAIFLTSTKHNHPIPLWANKPIFLGYLGWVRNFGFDSSVRNKELHDVYSGQSNANKIIKKYKISYIYVGPSEQMEFSINYNYLKKFPVAFENEDTVVYDVRKLWK